MVLNLDQNFKPIDGEEIQFQNFVFSGGEPHIKIDPKFDLSKSVIVTHRLHSFNDLGLLCMAVDALKRLGAKLDTLVIPYFPAARQDRIMTHGEPLSVRVYSDIINTLHFPKVIIFDAHSEVTAALVNNCQVIPNHLFIRKVIETIESNVMLISPDGGALKKIYKLAEYLGGIEVIECSKSRDVKSGKLSGFKVYADDLYKQDCLIVDDICDGGGTFIGLATELKKKNAGKLYLAISHGIFSKGLLELDCFDHIYTTDSFLHQQNNRLTTIGLQKFMNTE